MIDWSKYCDALLSVDTDESTCVVEPGIVLDVLYRELQPFGLEYGPEPATHYNSTIGGMIGNNSCGATAQRTGKVVDNLVRLEVLLHDGTRFWCGRTSDEEYAEIVRAGGRRAEVYRSLRELRDEYLARIRTGYPQIPRRVSGYNLDSLLPENGFDVAAALVGSESTLVTVLRAELRLVPVVAHRTLVQRAGSDLVASISGRSSIPTPTTGVAPARLGTGPGTGGIRLIRMIAGPSADPRQLLPRRQIRHARGAEPGAATTIPGCSPPTPPMTAAPAPRGCPCIAPFCRGSM